ncbi:hypothetical protein [Tardiphaga sp. 42S5]|uniref:hypothetical protein n=1 Tax=Tardiphaga sp. 42S5 TaxID=1404799 RepID=UPI002A5AD300|nr:hypothetical protein [Tardiphaga sp. 42S5]WPO42526.1 hypothetical protein SFY93_05045 [Tardiphaga sp. 42S5]
MNEVAERDAHGRLLPGKSLNPGGRPKIVEEIRELARQHAPVAFKRVCDLVESADERTALAAAQEILNRAYGKPMQAIEQKVEHLDIRQLYLEALQLANGHGAKVVDGRVIEPETDW